MAKQTIPREELDELLTTLENSLKKINRTTYKGDPFGDDALSIGELIDVARDLILSLRSLTRSKHTYSMLVERDERQAIASKLETLIKNVKDERIDLLFKNLSETVKLLRGMNLRSGWSLVAGAKESAYELERKAASLEKREKSLQLTLAALENKAAEIEQIKSQIQTYSKSIGQFVANIEQREVQLEQQSEASSKFEDQLETFGKQQASLLKNAEHLIQQAEMALEVKTAEGLSTAFKAKAEKAGSKSSLLWVALATVFVGGALYIGHLLIQSPTLGVAHVLARLSLIPVLLTGAWFAASRYVFQKSLAEDYDYKQVLMSSHVAFARQLKEDSDSDDYYQDYIRGFLREIYQHPVKPYGSNTKKSDTKEKATLEVNSSPSINRLASRIEEVQSELSFKMAKLQQLENDLSKVKSLLEYNE